MTLHNFTVEALRNLMPEGGWSVTGTEVSFHTSQKVSELEIQTKIQELKAAEPMHLLRQERNLRLAETDWITLKAYSQKQDVSEDWANYMQALRDLPATAEPQLDDQGNLINVDWPEVPK